METIRFYSTKPLIETMRVLLQADDTLIISTKPLIETMHVLLHADDTLLISTKPLIETIPVLLHAYDALIISTDRNHARPTPCSRYAHNQY